MPSLRDPRPEMRLVETYPIALAVARRKYPFLKDRDHEDIVQEAIANVLARLRRGPLADPVSYLLRVVYTTGAHLLRDRHRTLLSLESFGDGEHDGVELYADRTLAPLSPEEHALSRHDCDVAWRVLTEQLTADERLALVRRTIDGATPAEVADELGVSVRRYRRLRESAGRALAAAVADERPDDLADSASTSDATPPVQRVAGLDASAGPGEFRAPAGECIAVPLASAA